DFMRLPQTVAAQGLQVSVYTQPWDGECPDNFESIRVPVNSRTNHGRNAEYYAWVLHHLSDHPVARVVGFNKMPVLDVYSAADVGSADHFALSHRFFYTL
ncbi:glycosyltransferase family 1 protein, partial [Salmonella enterica subsp. enterica serovar Infantis]|nr:glycosyltransferase family 1 protein [Salmonella enterica subsp. enterica serovar Infantis]